MPARFAFTLFIFSILAIPTVEAAPLPLVIDFGGADFSLDGGGTGSGGTLPLDPDPTARATIATTSTANQVKITLEFDPEGITSNDVDRLKTLYLNVSNPAQTFTIATDSSLDPNSIFKSSSGPPSTYQNDGAGRFDFKIDFNQNKFSPGDSLMFTITGSNSLLPSDFNHFSEGATNDNGNGSLIAAIHINNTGTGFGSGDYAGTVVQKGLNVVPEPASLAIWSCLVGGCAVRLRRKRK